MMNCEEVSRLMSAKRDRELPLGTRIGVRLHLLMCTLCRIFGRQLEFLGGLGRAAGETGDGSYLVRYGLAEESLSSEAKARIKDRLSGASS